MTISSLPETQFSPSVWAILEAVKHSSEDRIALTELLNEFEETAANELLVQALLANGVDAAKEWRKESGTDLVARAFVAMLNERNAGDTSGPVWRAFSSARFRTADVSRRVVFEFQGPTKTLPDKAEELRTLLSSVLDQEGYSEHVQLEALEGFIYVGRGGLLRAPVSVDNDSGQRRPVKYRPAVTDRLHFDSASGLLRVTARTRQLAKLYADAMGKVFFNDAKLFADAGGCSLELLREGMEALLPPKHSPIQRVDLMSFEATKGTASISGKHQDVKKFADVFEDLEFTEAALRAYLFDNTKIDFKVRAGKGVVYKDEQHRETIERYLEEVGIRSPAQHAESFSDLVAVGSVSIGRWRAVLGARCDEFVKLKILQQSQLSIVKSVDADEELVVQMLEDGSLVGNGRKPEDGMRVLTASDVDGVTLSLPKLAEFLAKAFGCAPEVTSLDDGRLWLLGRLKFVNEVEPFLVLVIGRPSTAIKSVVSGRIGDANFVALWAHSCSIEDEKRVIFRWNELDNVFLEIAEFLGVRGRLPIEVQYPSGLAMAQKSGLVVVDGKVAEIGGDSPAHRLLLHLAKVYPLKLTSGELHNILSPNRAAADGPLRDAKRDLKKKLLLIGVKLESLIGGKKGSCGLLRHLSVVESW
jgi:hypothetical protein